MGQLARDNASRCAPIGTLLALLNVPEKHVGVKEIGGFAPFARDIVLAWSALLRPDHGLRFK